MLGQPIILWRGMERFQLRFGINPLIGSIFVLDFKVNVWFDNAIVRSGLRDLPPSPKSSPENVTLRLR